MQGCGPCGAGSIPAGRPLKHSWRKKCRKLSRVKHQKVLIVFIVAPKNKRLAAYTAIALKDISRPYKLIEVRGEDVPFWLESTISANPDALGMTGEDLFKEYLLEKLNDTQLKILRRITWDDEKALFKKPTLCLLGPKDFDVLEKKKELKVCINVKYKMLAKRYLNSLEPKGYIFQKTYVSGTTENAISLGIADLVIEIVYSGSTVKEYNLKIYDKIFASDFVVIGGKNDPAK